jgi:hypothetical protein
MISKDLALDTTNDLTISSGGDWDILQTDDQNIEAIMKAEKGHFYQWPLLGYGITKRLMGPFRKNEERKAIREALKRDNYNVITLVITNDHQVYVDAVKIK